MLLILPFSVFINLAATADLLSLRAVYIKISLSSSHFYIKLLSNCLTHNLFIIYNLYRFYSNKAKKNCVSFFFHQKFKPSIFGKVSLTNNECLISRLAEVNDPTLAKYAAQILPLNLRLDCPFLKFFDH